MIWRYTITPEKANVVADALSRKSHVNAMRVSQMPQELCWEFEKLNLGFVGHTEGITIEVEPTLEQEIRRVSLRMIRSRKSRS